MSNSISHQLLWSLILGVFAVHLAVSNPVYKLPDFLGRPEFDEDCKDDRDDCEWIVKANEKTGKSLEEYCTTWKEYPAVIECRKTCGFCKAPAPPIGPIGCEDERNCSSIAQMSEDDLEEYCERWKNDAAVKQCAKTCQFCKAPVPPIGPTGCKDNRSDCNWILENVGNYLKEYCGYHRKVLERWCSKTCQFCSDNKEPAPTIKPETAKPRISIPPTTIQQPNEISPFQENCLEAHNEFRSWHNSAPLTWSADLTRDAQKWANHLASSGTFNHDPSLKELGEGENLLWFSPPSKLCNGPQSGEDCVTCREMVKMWYDEEKDWDYARGRAKYYGAVVLHFTQIVWKDTKRLGMATAVAHGRLVAVARYTPPGNLGDAEDFKKNVEAPDWP